jgi:hypothetical protein
VAPAAEKKSVKKAEKKTGAPSEKKVVPVAADKVDVKAVKVGAKVDTKVAPAQ